MQNKQNIENIVLFDGICKLCNRSVQFIIEHDKAAKIKFATLQSKYGQTFLKKHHMPVNDFDTFIFLQGENYYIKSAAWVEIMKLLPPPWSWLQYSKVLPTSMRDFFYDIIGSHRYRWFGKKDKCMVPDDSIKSRFIDE